MGRREGLRSWLLAAPLTAAMLFAARAESADVAVPLSTATPAAPSFDWTGWYFGGHAGYATGHTQWTATEAGASTPTLSGSLDLFNPFSSFVTDGSYFVGLQAGYNQRIGSRLVLGAETDIAFPALPVGLVGTQAVTSNLIGQASYQSVFEIEHRHQGHSEQ